MTSFSSVHICISFRLLRRGNMKLHALLGYPVSENFVSWCQTLKNSSASFLCIQETLIISTISQFESDSKMCTLQKCICVWSLDNWSQILSGKSFNTFSMARLKTLQFRLTLTPFHYHACISYLSFTIFFFMICDWGTCGTSPYGSWPVFWYLQTI